MKNVPFLLLGLLMWPVAHSALAQDKLPKPIRKSQSSLVKMAERRQLHLDPSKKPSPEQLQKLRAQYGPFKGPHAPKAGAQAPVTPSQTSVVLPLSTL